MDFNGEIFLGRYEKKRLVRLAQMEGPGFGHGAVQLLTPQTWSFWRSSGRRFLWDFTLWL